MHVLLVHVPQLHIAGGLHLIEQDYRDYSALSVFLVAAVPVAVAVAGILSSCSGYLFLSLALPRELRSN